MTWSISKAFPSHLHQTMNAHLSHNKELASDLSPQFRDINGTLMQTHMMTLDNSIVFCIPSIAILRRDINALLKKQPDYT